MLTESTLLHSVILYSGLFILGFFLGTQYVHFLRNKKLYKSERMTASGLRKKLSKLHHDHSDHPDYSDYLNETTTPKERSNHRPRTR